MWLNGTLPCKPRQHKPLQHAWQATRSCGGTLERTSSWVGSWGMTQGTQPGIVYVTCNVLCMQKMHQRNPKFNAECSAPEWHCRICSAATCSPSVGNTATPGPPVPPASSASKGHAHSLQRTSTRGIGVVKQTQGLFACKPMQSLLGLTLNNYQHVAAAASTVPLDRQQEDVTSTTFHDRDPHRG